MRAVSDYCFDAAPPPSYLKRAFETKNWNKNVDDLPAGELGRMSYAYNVWQAIDGYLGAARLKAATRWIRENPDAWKVVSFILSKRKSGEWR